MELKEFETPNIDPIFDLYVAYGYVESFVRAGANKIIFEPMGGSYIVSTDVPKDRLYQGLNSALEEMISLHKALGREKGDTPSEVDFSRGAIIEQGSQKKVPMYLSEILEYIRNGKMNLLNKKKYTIPLPLMPSAGKYLPQHFKTPTKKREVNALNYALAWVGFHYYTPYVRYTKGDATWVHIYQIVPGEEIDIISLLALKDLKMHLPHYYEERYDFLTNRRLALLYHLLHSESLGALEVLAGKKFVIRSYTLEKIGKNQAIRSFGEEEIGKLMDFLWHLKKEDLYHTIAFIDDLLVKVPESALALIDAVMNERLESFYLAFKLGERAGVRPSRKIVASVIKFIEEISIS
ncbi:hypothetical protein PNA2_1816 [Pyrococcus sp. NA2]|uniref:type I-A CRISPR-associated protein Cas8a2/Csa4 n=1 Tax=Pyrococcus sp. (strain NA2) TaxID=342949 RepID=UPI000209AC0D|nr:type I-A CRISPR-associated protein Cas8a2/Csa4 [Pyrococcus sp. NA2]AEC52731.1 hypothetical protein PNA2_1816 [Pyrococcus sp. NA2]